MTHRLARITLLAFLAAGCSRDADGDGFDADLDCNDASAEVFPGAEERCNEVDDDCDGEIDEQPVDAAPAYVDADGDGFGAQIAAAESCELLPDTSANSDDCDDTRPDVFPGAAEICHDGAVNDCDATEPPNCPLSGEIPFDIAIERRKIESVDYGALQLVDGADGGLPDTLVKSSRNEVVSLGPVIGGSLTAISARAIIEDTTNCTVGDVDLDGRDELLCARTGSGMFLVQSPLPDGTITVPDRDDIGLGVEWLPGTSDTGNQVVAVRTSDASMQFFSLPLLPGVKPAWEYRNPEGATLGRRERQPHPDRDLWIVFLDSTEQDLGGIDVVEVTDSGPQRLLTLRRTDTIGIRTGSIFDLDGDDRLDVVVWTRESPSRLLVLDLDTPGNWSVDDSRLESWPLTDQDYYYGSYDRDGDQTVDTLWTASGFVKLPIVDGDFTPYAWFASSMNARDLHFRDLDGDGHPEWIALADGIIDGETYNGVTVFPGNWP